MPEEINKFNMHFVCTHDEAKAIIDMHDKFYVSNCGCREKKGNCCTSRMDLCLIFNDDFPGSGTGKKEVSKEFAYGILKEADEKYLVSRPYRSETDKDIIDGICFCCDDCCTYFADSGEECDRGDMIEVTEIEKCTGCGLCTDFCYFNARNLQNDRLEIDRRKCYGCGICEIICPSKCVQMMKLK
jgi:Pyruvate/2-oxoacid:ferredoxin oxidoreductase delta subunit